MRCILLRLTYLLTRIERSEHNVPRAPDLRVCGSAQPRTPRSVVNASLVSNSRTTWVFWLLTAAREAAAKQIANEALVFKGRSRQFGLPVTFGHGKRNRGFAVPPQLHLSRLFELFARRFDLLVNSRRTASTGRKTNVLKF